MSESEFKTGPAEEKPKSEEKPRKAKSRTKTAEKPKPKTAEKPKTVSGKKKVNNCTISAKGKSFAPGEEICESDMPSKEAWDRLVKNGHVA